MFRQSSLAEIQELQTAPERELPAIFTKPDWWEREPSERDNYEGRCRNVVKAFVTGTLKGRMVGRATGGVHIYTTRKNGTELWLFKDNPSVKFRICVAKKVNGAFVGNASSMMAQRVGNKLSWLQGALKIQEVIGEVMPMVPFRLFKDNRLDINSFRVVDREPSQMLDLGRKRDGKYILTHFMGAMVFKLEIRSRSVDLVGHKDEFFLFDIDRNDLALKHMNPFLSKLPRPVTSIADAYDSLKPQEIRDAERFMSKPCPRHGEWFFIPSTGTHRRAVVEPRFGLGRKPFAEAVLQSNGNRAHYVSELSEDGFVKGLVRHGGGEHKNIVLDGWHKPVPNSAVGSFKITGAVD